MVATWLQSVHGTSFGLGNSPAFTIWLTRFRAWRLSPSRAAFGFGPHRNPGLGVYADLFRILRHVPQIRVKPSDRDLSTQNDAVAKNRRHP